MSSIFLAKKHVNIHGSWKAGYKFSDSLVKLISSELRTTQSKSGTIRLSSSALTVEILPTPDGKPRTFNRLPFDSLRDISVNPYQRNCLLIVYLDASQKFSVLVCSSQIEKDIFDFSKAYKDHKNFRLQSSHLESISRTLPNWTLQKSQDIHFNDSSKTVDESFASSHPSASSSQTVSFSSNNGGFVRNHQGSSQRSSTSSFSTIGPESLNDYEDVFYEAQVIVVHQQEEAVREHAGWTLDGRHEKVSVGIQTVPFEKNSDTESITSVSSKLSVSVTCNEVTNTREKSTGISSDVYHSMRDSQVTSWTDNYSTRKLTEQRHNVELPNWNRHVVDSSIDIDLSGLLIHENNNSTDNATEKKVYTSRSCGTQTAYSTIAARRYTKNLPSRSTSNSYREKAEAVRNGSSGSESKSPFPGFHDSVTRERGTQQSSSMTGSLRKSPFGHSSVVTTATKRRLGLFSTTVIKPIEKVYTSRSTLRAHSSRTRRPLIIYAPSLNHAP